MPQNISCIPIVEIQATHNEHLLTRKYQICLKTLAAFQLWRS
ncbi:hypothetical protein LINPERHAP1_LOCUS272 [Linum perenne]